MGYGTQVTVKANWPLVVVCSLFYCVRVVCPLYYLRVASLRLLLFDLPVAAHKLSRHALYVDWENQSYSSIDRQCRALQEIVSRPHETKKNIGHIAIPDFLFEVLKNIEEFCQSF